MTFAIPFYSGSSSNVNPIKPSVTQSIQTTVSSEKNALNQDVFEKTTVKSDTGASVNYRSGNSETKILERLAITSPEVIEGKFNHLLENWSAYKANLNKGAGYLKGFPIVLNGLEQTVKEHCTGGTKKVYKVKLTPDGQEYALALTDKKHNRIFEELPILQAWRDVGVASHDFSCIVPLTVGEKIDAIGVLMPLMDSTKHFDYKNAGRMNNRMQGIENIQNADDLEAFMETLVQQTIALKLKGINILGLGSDAINLKQHPNGEGLEYMIYDTVNPPNIEKAYKDQPFTEEEISQLIEKVDICSGEQANSTAYIQKYTLNRESAKSVAEDLTLLTQKANEKLEAQRKPQTNE
jgi:hypothetical protein